VNYSSEGLILYRLDELKADVGALSRDVSTLTGKVTANAIETAAIKVKSGVWGAIGGAIPAAIAALYWILK
jgi:hypothetical protein